jgi:predicted O-methyltransferase YrrM
MRYDEFKKTKEYDELPIGQLYIPDEECLYNYARGRVAEIGCLCGRSAAIMSINADSVTTIDIFDNYELIEDDKQRKHYRDVLSIYPHEYKIVKETLSKYNKIEVICGTSDKLLELGKFNFIFIDGDHSYNGVKRDFENALKVLNPKGTIAFHDAQETGDHAGEEVVRFIKENIEGNNKYIISKHNTVMVLVKIA